MPLVESERQKAIDEAVELCKRKAVLWHSRFGCSNYTPKELVIAYNVATELGTEISRLREVEQCH